MESPAPDFTYDEHGGIIETLPPPIPPDYDHSDKPHKAYTILEKMLFRNNMRVGFLFDEQAAKSRGYLKKLRITPTNRCSARCYYCPRPFMLAEGAGYMDYDFFTDLVDQGRALGVKGVDLGGWGEPTLHPRIFDMIEYAFGKGMKVGITSNFIPFDKPRLERLAQYPFDTMEMSMDGFNAAEYQAGKRVDQYSRAFSNVTYFFEQARKHKQPTHFNIHFVDTGNVSFANKLRFVRYWKTQMNGLDHDSMFFYEPLNCGGLCNDLSARSGLVRRLLRSYKLRKPCYLLGAFSINWDGGVFICTAHPMPYMKLGSLTDMTLDQLATHPLLAQYRQAHSTGNFDLPGCRNCDINSMAPLNYVYKQVLNRLFF